MSDIFWHYNGYALISGNFFFSGFSFSIKNQLFLYILGLTSFIFYLLNSFKLLRIINSHTQYTHIHTHFPNIIFSKLLLGVIKMIYKTHIQRSARHTVYIKLQPTKTIIFLLLREHQHQHKEKNKLQENLFIENVREKIQITKIFFFYSSILLYEENRL